MPNEVIGPVHLYARNSERGLTYGNRNGLPDDCSPFDSNGKSYDNGDGSDDGADNKPVEYDSKDKDNSDDDDNADQPTPTSPSQEWIVTWFRFHIKMWDHVTAT
jgi:hypothetical protein